MSDDTRATLRAAMDRRNFERLIALDNPELHEFVADAVKLCTPESVFICTDSPEDVAFVREQAKALGEEHPLKIPGHTYHFDGPQDQGRDREVTKYLVPANDSLGAALNQIEREAGLAEIRGLLKGQMKGRTMIVRFLSLGPTNSVFSIPCVQCTDSFYVAHSEDLLYRRAYEQFRALGPRAQFFRVLHSAGKLDENMISCEPQKKRIYIDYTRDTIYSVNTQYAGNTVGLKKLALRLTIRKADREGWLAEHMFLMGVHGPGRRKSYFAGAFPSGCGKTSTAMLRGETILGDDIAYLRNIGGEARAVNAECGIFGIIQNVKRKDDPIIYRVITRPGEVIFSNVLVHNGRPYWLGMGLKRLPKTGRNFYGEWHEGMTDENGQPVPMAHKNARYTVSLCALDNMDPELDNPNGVPLSAIIYGGRDAEISVPVQQAFNWDHGILSFGAWLETETTFTITAKEGQREINVMSIQDFLAIPIGKYIMNNLNFGRSLQRKPLIFGVNYFLCRRGATPQPNGTPPFVTGMHDKHVWIKWMERRVHGEMGALRTPTGLIPKFEDLAILFRRTLRQPYTREQWVEQFTIRVDENLAKLERVEQFYRTRVPDAPQVLYEAIAAQRERLTQARARHGKYISPDKFPEENA